MRPHTGVRPRLGQMQVQAQALAQGLAFLPVTLAVWASLAGASAQAQTQTAPRTGAGQTSGATGAQTQSLDEFLDQRAEQALLKDKDRVGLGDARLVRLSAQVDGFYANTLPSLVSARQGLQPAAGNRDNRVGLRWRAIAPAGGAASAAGLGLLPYADTVQWSQARSGEVRETTLEASRRLNADWLGAVRYGQSRAGGLGRAQFSAGAGTVLGHGWQLELSLAHRLYQQTVAASAAMPAGSALPPVKQTTSADVASTSLTWLEAVPPGQAGASASLTLGARLNANNSASTNAPTRTEARTQALTLAAQVPLAPDWSAYGEHTVGGDFLMAQALRADDAWRTRAGLAWAFAGPSRPDAAVYAEWRGRTFANTADQGVAVGVRNSWALNTQWTLSAFGEASHLLAGTAAIEGKRAGLGLARGFDGTRSLELGLEGTSGDNGESYRAITKYTTRATENSAVAVRWVNAGAARPASITEPLGGEDQSNNVKVYWVWREPGAKQWVSLTGVGLDNSSATRPTTAHTSSRWVSQQAVWRPSGIWAATVRGALRTYTDDVANTTTHSRFALARATLALPQFSPQAIHPLWSLSAHAASIANPIGSAGAGAGALPKRQSAMGFELGYRLARKVDLALGYNLRGFDESELQADDRLSKGAYLRLRYGFDVALDRWLP